MIIFILTEDLLLFFVVAKDKAKAKNMKNNKIVICLFVVSDKHFNAYRLRKKSKNCVCFYGNL